MSEKDDIYKKKLKLAREFYSAQIVCLEERVEDYIEQLKIHEEEFNKRTFTK